MSKRDDLMRAGGANVLASMGGGRGPELPAGLDPAAASRKPARLEGLSRDKEAARIAIDRIVADPGQPRKEFDPAELEALAGSLRALGQLQPIRVRWDEGQGAYVVIAGERRWRAARIAGLAALACVVQEGDMSPEERLTVQLVENALRSDLKPIEQANSYRALMDARRWSMRQLASELSIHFTSIQKALALLDLPGPIQDAVEQGGLAPSVAIEIGKLDRPEDQSELASAVVDQKLTRSEVAEAVKSIKARRPAPAARPEPISIDLGDGMVKISWKKSGQTAAQMLRRALKQIQAREARPGQDAA